MGCARATHHRRTLAPQTLCPAPTPPPKTTPQPTAGPPTLNAIAQPPETATDRTARHLRTCRELAELGMDVARPAAREAVSNLAAPIEHRMPATPLPPVCATPDPGRLFTRVSHAVRQAMALEARIAAGDLPALRDPAATQQRHPTPGRAPLRPQTRPGNPYRLEALEPLEDAFLGAADRPIPEILAAIRAALGLTPDAAEPRRSPQRAPEPAKPKPTPVRPIARGIPPPNSG